MAARYLEDSASIERDLEDSASIEDPLNPPPPTPPRLLPPITDAAMIDRQSWTAGLPLLPSMRAADRVAVLAHFLNGAAMSSWLYTVYYSSCVVLAAQPRGRGAAVGHM